MPSIPSRRFERCRRPHRADQLVIDFRPRRKPPAAPPRPPRRPKPRPPAPPKRRKLADPRHRLYARKALGRQWQARVWLPRPLGSVNLGLYATEREAHAAALAFVRRGADPVEHLPEGVLPKYVRRGVGGQFVARVKTRRGVVELGPFACPKLAHRAMMARLAR